MGKKSKEYEENETGYVTDSSFNSRKDSSKAESSGDRGHANNRRKTKSERNKRRSSRLSGSIGDAMVEAGSESSSLEQQSLRQPNHHRKRTNSKNENQRKRTESKNSITLDSVCEVSEETMKKEGFATIKMNRKDIYCGTWNPKERAVLDQIILNEASKPDKRTFKDMLKSKPKFKKEKYLNIPEEVSELPSMDKKAEKRMSFFQKIKENVKKTKSKNDVIVVEPRKKKNIFDIFSLKGDSLEPPRRRTQSIGESTLQQQRQEKRVEHLSRNRCGSSNSLKNWFGGNREKDDLKGAFEYYTDNEQVFHRSPSTARLSDKRSMSSEKLINPVAKTYSHGFEPAQISAKDVCYNEKLVYAQAKIAKPHLSSQRSLKTRQYDSAFEDDCSLRGGVHAVSSARAPFSRQQSQTSTASETGSYRAYSSVSAYCYQQPPARNYQPLPSQQQHRPSPPPYHHPHFQKRQEYVNRPNRSPAPSSESTPVMQRRAQYNSAHRNSARGTSERYNYNDFDRKELVSRKISPNYEMSTIV